MGIHTGHSLSPEGFSSKTPMASSFKSLLLETSSGHSYKNNLCHPYPVGLTFILWVSDLLSVSPARRYVCIKQVLFSILSSTNSRDNTVAGTYRCSITIAEWVNSFFFFFFYREWSHSLFSAKEHQSKNQEKVRTRSTLPLTSFMILAKWVKLKAVMWENPISSIH